MLYRGTMYVHRSVTELGALHASLKSRAFRNRVNRRKGKFGADDLSPNTKGEMVDMLREGLRCQFDIVEAMSVLQSVYLRECASGDSYKLQSFTTIEDVAGHKLDCAVLADYSTALGSVGRKKLARAVREKIRMKVHFDSGASHKAPSLFNKGARVQKATVLEHAGREARYLKAATEHFSNRIVVTPFSTALLAHRHLLRMNKTYVPDYTMVLDGRYMRVPGMKWQENRATTLPLRDRQALVERFRAEEQLKLVIAEGMYQHMEDDSPPTSKINLLLSVLGELEFAFKDYEGASLTLYTLISKHARAALGPLEQDRPAPKTWTFSDGLEVFKGDTPVDLITVKASTNLAAYANWEEKELVRVSTPQNRFRVTSRYQEKERPCAPKRFVGRYLPKPRNTAFWQHCHDYAVRSVDGILLRHCPELFAEAARLREDAHETSYTFLKKMV